MLSRMTNARKISVKMKSDWSKELEEKGFLTCPISGCSQTYVSMANFTTHFKWCSGEKNFGVCPYCASVIFSDRKATLHHMEVEHPDKIEEYKANYMITEEPDDACAGTSDALTPFESEVSDMYVEEVSSKKVGRKPKEKRLYSKENHLSPKRKFFRNKMKNINETVSENIKEFQKCVRFDSIVSKINSVSDGSKTAEILQEPSPTKLPKKDRKPRYVLTGNIEDTSFFEDDEDEQPAPTDVSILPDDPTTVKLHTKSKLVLDLERYKRYNEYLKWTRDWGSERKTYSRSKPSDRSQNSTITTLLSDSVEIQDVHQLEMSSESAEVSLPLEEAVPQHTHSLSEGNSVELNATPSEINLFRQNIYVDMEADIVPGNIRTPLAKDSSHIKPLFTEPALALPVITPDKPNLFYGEVVENRSKHSKYRELGYEIPQFVKEESFESEPIQTSFRSPQVESPNQTEELSRKGRRPRAPIITFGKQVIAPKPAPPNFDNLVKTDQKHYKKRKIMTNSPEFLELLPKSSAVARWNKSDGVKQPSAFLFPKRKRGRPSRLEVLQREHILKMVSERNNNVENLSEVGTDRSTRRAEKPPPKGIRGRLGKLREMCRLKGRSKFKSLMGTRNKFRGLNRIVYNARKISENMARKRMYFNKINLSDALTQTDSIETDVPGSQEALQNRVDKHPSVDDVEVQAQPEAVPNDEAGASEKSMEKLTVLENEQETVPANVSQTLDVTVETEPNEENASDVIVSSEISAAPEKDVVFDSPKSMQTSTPIASIEHQSFTSLAQDIENCSVISKVLADFETVTPKPRTKIVTSNQPSSSNLVSNKASVNESSNEPTPVPATASTTVVSTDKASVSSTIPSAVPASTNTPTIVPVTVLATTSTSSMTDAPVVHAKTTTIGPTNVPVVPAKASTNSTTDASAVLPAKAPTNSPTLTSTVVLAKALTNSPTTPGVAVPAKASTYVPTIVSITIPTKVPTTAMPGTPTKVSPSVFSIKVQSSTESPVPRSFKLNKKLIYHPEHENSRDLPTQAGKPVVERPITFDELRRSIMESSKVPTSLMALDSSVGACTEVVTQDPKATPSPARNKDGSIKRPRGRPRKQEPPQNSGTDTPLSPPVQKRPRGRPRKIRVEVSENSDAAVKTDSQNADSLKSQVDVKSASEGSEKPVEEETMEVDVAGEIKSMQEGESDSKSQTEEIIPEANVGDKSVTGDGNATNSEIIEVASLDESSTEKKNIEEPKEQVLENKVPENREKEASEIGNSDRPNSETLPVDEEQRETSEKETSEIGNSDRPNSETLPGDGEQSELSAMENSIIDPDGAVTSTPQVTKLIGSGNDSSIAENSTLVEDSHNASLNEESESGSKVTSDVSEVVKTPGRRGRKPKRGRKRKAESFSTPDQSTSLIMDSPAVAAPTPEMTPDANQSTDSPSLPRRRGRPRKVLKLEDPTLDKSLEDAALIAVRKSSRSKTPKVVTDYSVLEKTETEAKLVEHVPQPTPVRKGCRGRPRKHPLVVEESNSTPVSEMPPSEPEAEGGESAPKRGSRKSRPKKCVDYADLNSGNHDEMDKVIDGGRDERSDKADEAPQGDPEYVPPGKSHDDTFILPPKKRKRVSEKPEAVQGEGGQDPSSNQVDIVPEPQSTPSLEVTKAVEITPQVYVELFTEYLPTKSMYKLLNDSEYEAYLPPLKKSICFKIKAAGAPEKDWVSLSRFASLPIEGTNHYTFFTGGPVSSSAFCPTWEETQYIAVCTCSTMLEDHFFDNTVEEKGVIQIWNLGPLTDSGLKRRPRMELGISHNHGKVLEMTWCPTGGWQDSKKDYESLPRLGLLAAAFSDSCIRIYSVPHPEFLEKDGDKPPLYSASPCITLEPLSGGPCLATCKSSCTCLTWQRSNGCEKIAGGYGNGMVCLWLVHSSATICASNGEDRVYFPYKIFQAHGTPVNGVSFSPLNDRWIVTCSFDRTVKFFDLLDPSVPFCNIKPGFSRKAHWANNFCGAYVCLDDDVVFKGSAFFKECGTENFSTINISAPHSLLCESSLSAVLDYFAIADVDGTVSINVLKNMHVEYSKCSCFTNHKIYQTEIVPCDKLPLEALPIEQEDEEDETPANENAADPLGDFITSLGSDESDDASLSNSLQLVQFLDVLKEQNSKLELTVMKQLKVLCLPLQEMIDSLQDMDENSFIKCTILEKCFALNNVMFNRILDIKEDAESVEKEDDVITQSEPSSTEMETENCELNLEKNAVDSSQNNNNQSTEHGKEDDIPHRGDSNKMDSESLSQDSKEVEISSPVVKEAELNLQSSVPDSKATGDSDPTSKEIEKHPQSGASDLKEVETESSPVNSEDRELVAVQVISGSKELSDKESGSVTVISDPKVTDSQVSVESKPPVSSDSESGKNSLVSTDSMVETDNGASGSTGSPVISCSQLETLQAVSDSSKESSSQGLEGSQGVLDSKGIELDPCLGIESESLSAKQEGETDSREKNAACVSTVESVESVSPQISEMREGIDFQPSLSGSIATESLSLVSEIKKDESDSLISDIQCVSEKESSDSQLVEKEPKTVSENSPSIPISQTPLESSAHISNNQNSEKLGSSETEMVIDKESNLNDLNTQNPDEFEMEVHVNESKSSSSPATLNDAQIKLLPCDSTTENSKQAGVELLPETMSSSQADDVRMEIDAVPNEEEMKQDDIESIASELLEADAADDFSDFSMDSDSDDSLISECSIVTESAEESSEPPSPFQPNDEDSMDMVRDLKSDPPDDRCDAVSVPTTNCNDEVVTSALVEKTVASPDEPPVTKEPNQVPPGQMVPECPIDQPKESLPSCSSSSVSVCDTDSDIIVPLSASPSSSTVEEKQNVLNSCIGETLGNETQNVAVSQNVCSGETTETVEQGESVDQKDSCVGETPDRETIQTTSSETETSSLPSRPCDIEIVEVDPSSHDLGDAALQQNAHSQQEIANPLSTCQEEGINQNVEENIPGNVASEMTEEDRSTVENIKSTDLASCESSENGECIAENTETLDSIPEANDTVQTQTRKPPTKKTFLQGLKYSQGESIFNSSRDIKKEEYLAKYKIVKPVKEEYEALAENHGLVFRDLFLNDPSDPNKGSINELPDREINLNSYGISSINTISWNPNQDSKYWIFSAGNSGIARLSCLSNIASLEQSKNRRKR